MIERVTAGVAGGITGCDGGVVTEIDVRVLGVQPWVTVGWLSESGCRGCRDG